MSSILVHAASENCNVILTYFNIMVVMVTDSQKQIKGTKLVIMIFLGSIISVITGITDG